MKETSALHRLAMEAAERAAIEQALGNTAHARTWYAEAFRHELQAAERFDSRQHAEEPTRSVLFRSAASLALDCGDHRSAEKLIARALLGDPPPEIAEELRDLIEQVYFQRHLDTRGVVLEPREFQVSLDGNAVGHGLAQSDLFIGRIQDLERLIYRTAERKAGRNFREHGRPSKAVSKGFGLYLSVPRAASFAVTVRLGYSNELQTQLPGMDPAESIVSDLLDCIEVLEHGDSKKIEELIPDAAYRRNFLALARRIAPDGNDVKVVGFTAPGREGERRVSLTRTVSEIRPPVQHEDQTGKPVTLFGTLRYADSTITNRNEIRLLDEQGRKLSVIVPEGMMDDIVKPLWDSTVKVVGTYEKRKIKLVDISRSEEPESV